MKEFFFESRILSAQSAFNENPVISSVFLQFAATIMASYTTHAARYSTAQKHSIGNRNTIYDKKSKNKNTADEDAYENADVNDDAVEHADC